MLFIDTDTLFRRAALCSLHFSRFIPISAEDSLALCFSPSLTLCSGTLCSKITHVCLREDQVEKHTEVSGSAGEHTCLRDNTNKFICAFFLIYKNILSS